jgi:DNA repair photolyase
MSVIYTPQGRAREYSHLALNLYAGCWYQCRYCYVPNALRMTRQKWSEIQPLPRPGVLGALAKEAPALRGTRNRVLLSFSSDPYQPIAVATGTTGKALAILRDNDVPFQVLTKGGVLAEEDFGLYGPRDAFAVTLTGVQGGRPSMEPKAARPAERIESLLEAKRSGIETWVSLEPVLDPEQSLEVIHRTHDFVDLYKIGKINHDVALGYEIDWNAFAYKAVNLCEKYSVRYYVKKDLAAYCDFAYRNTDNRVADWKGREQHA